MLRDLVSTSGLTCATLWGSRNFGAAARAVCAVRTLACACLSIPTSLLLNHGNRNSGLVWRNCFYQHILNHGQTCESSITAIYALSRQQLC